VFKNENKGNIIYPHNGRYENGRWLFDFPDSWYNHHTVNKAIGMRRIRAQPSSRVFPFIIRIVKSATTTLVLNPIIHFTPHMEIEECLSALASAVNNNIAALKPDEQGKWPTLLWAYDNLKGEVNLFFTAPDPAVSFRYTLLIPDRGTDFWEWLNVPVPLRDPYTVPRTDGEYIFPNVWDRRDLYIHASFVNYTSYGYLGRDGEFYPKPSKIYHFEWQPMQFFFEVSFDGMRPVILPYERFEVELSFIIDDKRYQSK
jgi:hypothetical protein